MCHAVLCRLLAAVAVCLVAGTAAAGPWPRGQGATFLSFGLAAVRSDRGAAQRAGVYAEFGRTPRLTFAGKIERRAGPDAGLSGEAGLALALTPPGAATPLAAGLSLVLPVTGAARLRPALHVGRGFARPLDGGWLRLSLAAEIPLGGGSPATDVFVQGGLRAFGGRTAAMLSLGAYGVGGRRLVTLTPALALRVAPGTHLVVEHVHEIGHDRSRRFGLMLWRAF